MICMFLVIAVVVAAIVGCGKSSQTSQPSEQENQQENIQTENTQKDELVLAVRSEPDDGFDPTTGWGRYGSPLFQSTLLTFDDELNVVNDLAVNYLISEDGLTWTVEIRDDVVFSDGVPLTAQDVVYTFETAKSSGSVVDLNVLESIEAVSDYTIEFTLERTHSAFIDILITLGIVPKHAHGSGYGEHPVGSGPFTFVQWDKGQQLIIERNPKYYGKQPNFRKITFLYLDENTALAAAKAGQVDLAAVPAAFGLQIVNNMRVEALQSVDNRGILFPFVPAGQTSADGLPVGNDVTADLAIRQAINVGINRAALVEGVLEGFGTPAYTVADGLPWWNSDTVIEDADFEAAKAILRDGGWEETAADGILRKGDIKAEFRLVYPISDNTRQSLALAVADLIRPLGINIIPEGKSWDDIGRIKHSDAVLFGWGAHTPLEMYHLHSSEMAGSGWFNSGFYSNPQVDEYMAKALAAGTVEEANQYWQKAQWDGSTGISAKGDAPWAWLVNLDHVYFVHEQLDIGNQRVQPHGHGWPVTANIVDWQWK
ncbi:nickel ABC transporter substrate-binding protein [Desulfuribacillus alkaliarsenatis]|uniref:Nickel ABC transporter substrate-binding protein n=2 Tax=Desulfuribacillus alkaliarsenatis TaxID=766136 RepID=A0A1E5G2S4_9FIRM|nr:nickel ABC transporter substrate-binding protein [Desulfuribacillus alkaliarsenatis]